MVRAVASTIPVDVKSLKPLLPDWLAIALMYLVVCFLLAVARLRNAMIQPAPFANIPIRVKILALWIVLVIATVINRISISNSRIP